MNKKWLQGILIIGYATLLTASHAFAQQHKWAGRTLDDLEWAVHEKLAVLPGQGVFDTIRFEVQGKTVTLSGLVVNKSAKDNAELAIQQVGGIDGVVNRIEVLPQSKRDDALRLRVYRAIYEKAPLEKYGTRSAPSIHIIVKDGWVTLEGVVDSQADRSIVILRALNATPHVSDNLRVAAESQKAEELR